MRSLLRNLLLFFLIVPSAWADTGTSDSTLSITPSATAGTTITAADENDRNGDITTWANAHDHDLDNTTNWGDGTAGNKLLCADAADSTDACLRWDDTNNLWQVDHITAGTFNQIAVITSTTGLSSHGLLLGNGHAGLIALGTAGTSGQTLQSNGANARPSWTNQSVFTDLVTFTRTGAAGSGTQAITGLAFQPSSLMFFCTDDAADEGRSWGWSDDDSDEHNMRTAASATDFDIQTTTAILVNDVSVGGANNMGAVVTSYDSSGFTLTWTEAGTGPDVTCTALAFR